MGSLSNLWYNTHIGGDYMDKLYGNQREAVLVGYLAGILDGEGSVSLKKIKPNKHRKTPGYEGAVTLGMVYEEIVQLFVDRYGGTIRVERVPNRRPIYRYAKVGNEGVRNILEELTPYLIEKRERAEMLLEFYDSIDTKRYFAEDGKRLRTSEKELSLREDFYLRMKELNQGKHPQRLTERTPEKVK